MAGEEGASFTLSQEELYRLGLSFYKEQEAKGLQVVDLCYRTILKVPRANDLMWSKPQSKAPILASSAVDQQSCRCPTS